MNREQAAARLRVVRNAVLYVADHPGGHVATLYDGRQMLIGPTVARRYVPEVDGPVHATGGPISPGLVLFGEQGPEPYVMPVAPSDLTPVTSEPAAEQAKEPPARRPPAETAAIREWANSAGYKLAPKGRIPAEVVAAYENRDQEVTPDAP